MATPTHQLRVWTGMPVKTDRGVFESNRGNEVIGQMINGKFSQNGYFEGTLAPIRTGWRDMIYGSSLKLPSK